MFFLWSELVKLCPSFHFSHCGRNVSNSDFPDLQNSISVTHLAMISPWRSSCCESTFSKTQLQHLCMTSENGQHSNVVHYFHFFPIMLLGKSWSEIMFYQLSINGLVLFNGLKVCIRVWFSWNLVLFVSDGCWWIAWPISCHFKAFGVIFRLVIYFVSMQMFLVKCEK